MNAGVEQEIATRMRDAVAALEPPRPDLKGIRRAGRRRRRARAGRTIGVAVAAFVAGMAGGGIYTLLSPQPSYSAFQQTSGSGTAAPSPAVTATRAFYQGYPAAAARGQVAVDRLIARHTAAWYAPVARASAGRPDGPPGCGMPAHPSAVSYRQVAVTGGERMILVRWSASGGSGMSVVATAPGTTRITGVACVRVGGAGLTPTAARAAVRALYGAYATYRGQGVPVIGTLDVLLAHGPSEASGYLRQARNAEVRGTVLEDPLLCVRHGSPPVSVGPAKVIAGGAAGIVLVRPRGGAPIPVVVARGAAGWTVVGVACPGP